MADSVGVVDLTCPRCTDSIHVGVFASPVEPAGPHAVRVTLSAEQPDHTCADLATTLHHHVTVEPGPTVDVAPQLRRYAAWEQ